MYILLYKNNKLEDLFHAPGGLEIKTNSEGKPVIKFGANTLDGVNVPFLILQDNPGLERGDGIPDELFTKDQTDKYLNNDDLRERIARLEEENTNLSLTILELYETMLGGLGGE